MSLYDPMGSHAPLLAALASACPSPIAEMGAGYYSTPLLHLICQAQAKKLYTYETNPVWLKKFHSLQTDHHTLIEVSDWNIDLHMRERVGLAFVDNAPGESRAEIISRLKLHADIVLVHDTETDHATAAGYGYEPAFAKYKYRWDFRWMRPYCTALSMENMGILNRLSSVWPKQWTPPPDCPCKECKK